MRTFWQCDHCTEDFGAPVGVEINMSAKYIKRSMKLLMDHEEKHKNCGVSEIVLNEPSFDRLIEWWNKNGENIKSITKEEFMSYFAKDLVSKNPEQDLSPPPYVTEPESLGRLHDLPDPSPSDSMPLDFW